MEYGLIGEKLEHSFSKAIHERIAPYTYDLCPLNKDEFAAFMKQRDFRAINVTIPYKQAVLPYVDELDEHAKAIGAVNTIVNRKGRLYGYNTDVSGFLYMVRHHNIIMKDKKVIVLGNGGASKAIQAAIQQEQAKTMVVVDISLSKDSISYEECYANHSDASIIINTSPVGMYPNITQSPIDLTRFPSCTCVMDVVYNPILTKLCFDAQELGMQRVNGLEMLIAQAVYAASLFLDKKFDEAIIDTIFRDLQYQTCNIVLIGMPSAGKTTIGRMLEEKLHKPFIDLDDVIVEKAGKSIPEIFAENGEEGFRKLETEAAIELSKLCGHVIATGGGTIKKKINMDYLRLNGITIFIDRDVQKLISSDPNRPLSESQEALKQMHTERLPLYHTYAEHVVLNNADIADTLRQVLDAYQKVLLAAA